MITLKHEQSTIETAISTSACQEPQLQSLNPEFLMPFSAELYPVILDSVSSKSAVTLKIWIRMSVSGNTSRKTEYPKLEGTQQGSLSPDSGSIWEYPEVQPYVWQHCPEIPWTSAALGCDRCPGGPLPCSATSQLTADKKQHQTLYVNVKKVHGERLQHRPY